MQAVDALRLEHQFGKRQREQRAHFLAGPVVADEAEPNVAEMAVGGGRTVVHRRTMATDRCKIKPGTPTRVQPSVAHRPYRLQTAAVAPKITATI